MTNKGVLPVEGSMGRKEGHLIIQDKARVTLTNTESFFFLEKTKSWENLPFATLLT